MNAWVDGIRDHDPERVAANLTKNALFQGVAPMHSLGRPGVISSYDKQPVGLSPEYHILDNRQLSDTTLISYVDGSWLISQYHVSRIE